MFDKWNRKSWFIFVAGMIVGLLSLLLMNQNIVLTIVLAFFLESIAIYYTMFEDKKIEFGSILSWYSSIVIFMEVVWVWEYFKYPPGIGDSILAGIYFMLLTLNVYMIYLYLINNYKLSFFLHRQVLNTQLVKLVINVVIPVIRLQKIDPFVSYVLIGLLILLSWVDIVKELDTKHG